jgi:virulence factor Mce-like protein
MRDLASNRAALGAVLLTTLLAIVVAIDSGLVTSKLSEGGHTIHAEFRNTGQLKKGDPVRVDGVVAGRVKRLRLAPGGRAAIVDLTVFDNAGTVHADASARIRWRTALGGTFAVDLEPGTAITPPLGDRTIAASRTENQVEIEDAIAFDRGAAKDGLRTTLKELPAALQPEPVVTAATTLDADAPALAATLGAIRGPRETDLRRVVRATASTVRAIDAPNDAVRHLIEGAAATVAITARRGDELQRTLRLTGRIQPRVRRTLSRLRDTLGQADPLIARLTAAAPTVAPTLRGLRPTVRSADRLLATARPVTQDLQQAAHSLAATSRSGARLVDELTPSIDRLANAVLPGLAERDPVTELRTYQILGPTIASLNGSASTFDAEGHLFRFPALGGERTIANLTPCNVLLTDPEERSILKCNQLLSGLKRALSHRPPTPKAGR